MRSVRALDVLFTAQSAINLLSRVVASQTGNLCRVDPHASTHEANAEDSNNHNTTSRNDIKPNVVNVASYSPKNPPAGIEVAPYTSKPHIIDAVHTSNEKTASKEPSISHISVRQRYTKPTSNLFRSLEPNSLEPVTKVNECSFMSFFLTLWILGPGYYEGFQSTIVPCWTFIPLWRYVWSRLSAHFLILLCIGLAAGMSMGAASEFVRRAVNPSDTQGSVLMSEANVSRLVDKLSRMRGAALKLGQFMSIQGE